MRFAIGEFSRITGLPVRTLRFYHEKGVLAPSAVDPASGYRYYDERSLARARVVVALRRFEFPLEEIATILAECDEEADLIKHLESQKLRLDEAIRRRRAVVADLDRVIRSIEEGRIAIQTQSTQRALCPQPNGGLIRGHGHALRNTHHGRRSTVHGPRRIA